MVRSPGMSFAFWESWSLSLSVCVSVSVSVSVSLPPSLARPAAAGAARAERFRTVKPARERTGSAARAGQNALGRSGRREIAPVRALGRSRREIAPVRGAGPDSEAEDEALHRLPGQARG